jgi:branched-chain amino acid transport system ATP-binding protein
VAVAAAVFAVMPLLLKSLVGWDYILGALLLVYAMAHNPGGVAAAIREAREKREAKQKTEDHEAGMHDLPSLPRPDNLASTVAVPGTTLLEVVDLTVRFGGLTAVDDASITVPAGQIVGLIGPNGAGKSTLFNAAGGFVTPNAGRVRFNGRDITELAPHQRAALGIGRTFQHTGLARNLSVLENLLLAQHSAATYGWGEALLYVGKAGPCEEELHRRSIEVIEALGFAEKTDVPVRNLSGGQQRIVELACALVTAPQLLMLDEPSAGMAPAAVENLAQRLRELRDDLGRTVLLIEHHIPLVLDVCDHVYVLDAGRIIASGAPAEIAALPEVMTAYLGEEVAVLA